MRCFIFERKSTQALMPILEVGGKVLADGEQILVRSDLGATLAKKYAPYITKVGETTRAALKHGYFEYTKGQAGVSAKVDEDSDTDEAQPLKKISSDRSMEGSKTKVRRKGR